jgi:hypothetical protein
MVTINCISSDNEGVEKVELWVNGVSTDISDNTEPYSFDWNTTLIDNGSYSINVRSYDTSDNTTDSEPIVLTIDNTQSNPQPINITSVVFDNGGFTITWNQSTDGDFSTYELEKSTDSTMNSQSVVFTTDSLEQTTYFDTDVDPLIYQYYQVTVIDTFDYETKGEIVSSSLDPVPASVNVESVEYDTTQITVTWSESSDDDFRDYKLLYSESVSGDRDTLATYTDKSTTSHIITDFDPTYENWYWVEVSDTLGQTVIGTGMTNVIANPPNPVKIISIFQNQEVVTITWEKFNNSSDKNNFESYNLIHEPNSTHCNETIDFNDPVGDSVLYTTFLQEDTSFTYTHNFLNTCKVYRVEVTDGWGLKSVYDWQYMEYWTFCDITYDYNGDGIIDFSDVYFDLDNDGIIGFIENLEAIIIDYNGDGLYEVLWEFVDINNNGIYDAGDDLIADYNEDGIISFAFEFEDTGLDGIPGTNDYGEGNGVYDISPEYFNDGNNNGIVDWHENCAN